MSPNRRQRAEADEPDGAGGEARRLDRWLYFARVVKTRSLAQKLCEAGHVRVNRQKVKNGAKPVRPGDVLTVSLSSTVRVLRLEAVGERRGPAREAQTLFTELDPETPGEGASD